MTSVSQSVAAPGKDASSPDSKQGAPPSVVDPSGPFDAVPSVTLLEKADVRVSPSGSAAVSILARGEEAFVARLEMKPGAVVPEHRDATEEYIHVLEGTGTVTVAGTDYRVRPGSTIFMRPGEPVSFRNGHAPMVALQVFAGPEPAAKYDSWELVSRDGQPLNANLLDAL